MDSFDPNLYSHIEDLLEKLPQDFGIFSTLLMSTLKKTEQKREIFPPYTDIMEDRQESMVKWISRGDQFQIDELGILSEAKEMLKRLLKKLTLIFVSNDSKYSCDVFYEKHLIHHDIVTLLHDCIKKRYIQNTPSGSKVGHLRFLNESYAQIKNKTNKTSTQELMNIFSNNLNVSIDELTASAKHICVIVGNFSGEELNSVRTLDRCKGFLKLKSFDTGILGDLEFYNLKEDDIFNVVKPLIPAGYNCTTGAHIKERQIAPLLKKTKK